MERLKQIGQTTLVKPQISFLQLTNFNAFQISVD